MDKREELRRKLEQIEREKAARQEQQQQGQDEALVPSTEDASKSPSPVPSVTLEQIQAIAQDEIKRALGKEREVWQGESESERARTEAQLDEVRQELTNTNERVLNLAEDTHDSLIPLALEISELRTQQNSRVLPPAPEPRNVTPRPMLTPVTWSPPIMYPRRPSLSEPQMQGGAAGQTSYQPPHPQSISHSVESEQNHRTEPLEPLPTFMKIIYALPIVGLLALVICLVVMMVFGAWLNPRMAAAILAAIVVLVIWMGAVYLSWQLKLKMLSISIVLGGVLMMSLIALVYTTYQSWTETRPEINELGR